MSDHEGEALRDFVSSIGQIVRKADALRDAIARYDAWKAQDERLWAEAERTGDWRAYKEWLNS